MRPVCASMIRRRTTRATSSANTTKFRRGKSSAWTSATAGSITTPAEHLARTSVATGKTRRGRTSACNSACAAASASLWAAATTSTSTATPKRRRSPGVRAAGSANCLAKGSVRAGKIGPSTNSACDSAFAAATSSMTSTSAAGKRWPAPSSRRCECHVTHLIIIIIM